MAKPPQKSLLRAAGGGALVGTILIVLNLSLQDQAASAGFLAIALMVLGGAVGGAVLFTFVALVVRLLNR